MSRPISEKRGDAIDAVLGATGDLDGRPPRLRRARRAAARPRPERRRRAAPARRRGLDDRRPDRRGHGAHDRRHDPAGRPARAERLHPPGGGPRRPAAGRRGARRRPGVGRRRGVRARRARGPRGARAAGRPDAPGARDLPGCGGGGLRHRRGRGRRARRGSRRGAEGQRHGLGRRPGRVRARGAARVRHGGARDHDQGRCGPRRRPVPGAVHGCDPLGARARRRRHHPLRAAGVVRLAGTRRRPVGQRLGALAPGPHRDPAQHPPAVADRAARRGDGRHGGPAPGPGRRHRGVGRDGVALAGAGHAVGHRPRAGQGRDGRCHRRPAGGQRGDPDDEGRPHSRRRSTARRR